ncbi:MAG: GNAT family N-acetyltransferase [Thermoplasmata archaeon]|nr:GNAT family N-acetyltransferase [Thermoplasmata archaeon]
MDSSAIVYRPASGADVDKIAEAYAWLTAPPGKAPPTWDLTQARSSILQAISGSASTVLVAGSGAVLVGFATVYLDLVSVRFGLRAWVEDLAVHPEYRSRGIGKVLLDGAKRWARSRGASQLALESSEARVDAHRFYERERPASRSRAYHWDLRS